MHLMYLSLVVIHATLHAGGVVGQVQHQRKVLLLPGCTPNLLSILRV